MNPRGFSIKIINEIIYKNNSRDSVFEKYFGSCGINEPEKSLIFNIVMNVLRYKDIFDDIIKEKTHKPLFKLDKTVLTAIETALAQILTMNRIPVYAAVSETIDGYKQITNDTKGAGFLNYSLRRLTEDKNLMSRFENYKKSNSLLRHFLKELISEIPYNDIYSIYSSSYEKGHIAIRVRTDINYITDILKKHNIEYSISEIIPDAVLIKNINSLNILKEILPINSFVIQSELSQIAPYLLDVKEGESVLDVCSGNQIKAMQISDLSKGKSDITSIDIKEIKDFKFRFIQGDASEIRLEKEYDKILIDPPCSGLGTLSLNPEIKYRIRLSSIKRFSAIQYKILKNISQFLKKSGVLLYSVCTVTDSETVNIIKKFVEENPRFEIIRSSMDNPLLKRFTDKSGFIRIVNYNNSSFFYSLLKRKDKC